MSEPRFRIHFHKTETGRCQACDYAREMGPLHQAKAKELFIALSALGREMSGERGKYLRDGVWELRVIVQHHQHRFLYSFWKDIIVVTNAFLKKTPRVPDPEIERARRLMDEFIRSRGWEEL